MTRFVQTSGYRGMQIEINWRFLDPEGHPEAALRIVEWLREVIAAAPGQAASGRDPALRRG